METKKIRFWLLFLSGFVGIGAALGAVMMFVDSSGAILGIDEILPRMARLPFADILFQDYLIPGFALLLVNGISNGIAFFAIKRGSVWGAWLQLVCGVLLLMWLSVQWMIFEVNALTTIYTLIALAQIYLALKLKRIIA